MQKKQLNKPICEDVCIVTCRLDQSVLPSILIGLLCLLYSYFKRVGGWVESHEKPLTGLNLKLKFF